MFAARLLQRQRVEDFDQQLPQSAKLRLFSSFAWDSSDVWLREDRFCLPSKSASNQQQAAWNLHQLPRKSACDVKWKTLLRFSTLWFLRRAGAAEIPLLHYLVDQSLLLLLPGELKRGRSSPAWRFPYGAQNVKLTFSVSCLAAWPTKWLPAKVAKKAFDGFVRASFQVSVFLSQHTRYSFLKLSPSCALAMKHRLKLPSNRTFGKISNHLFLVKA